MINSYSLITNKQTDKLNCKVFAYPTNNWDTYPWQRLIHRVYHFRQVAERWERSSRPLHH